MANLHAVHSVGQSLVSYLNNTYPESLRNTQPCSFQLVSSSEVGAPSDEGAALTVFLYRVTVNQHLRNSAPAANPSANRTPLSLDLHFLLSVWADNALAEQTILAWTMLQLHQHPVLDTSSLSPEAEWGAGDFVQLIPAELAIEEVMRIWDALEPAYRLSVSYIARVVRIDVPEEEGPPVVASRFAWQRRKEEGR